jgi:23S rRNA (guanosine2251-2'-O)-methyltransferase
MVVYGINPVLEALKADRVSRILLGPRGLAKFHAASGHALDSVLPALSPRLADLVRDARAHGVPVEVVEAADLERLTRGGVHQGVAADVAADREPWTVASLVGRAGGIPLLVVLDGIEDPQNVGAILRSADAAGVDGVVRQTRRSAPLDGTAAKASAGAFAHVRVADVVNVSRALEELKAAGVWVVGLAAEGGEDYDAVDLTVPTAIVVGAEGKGLRRLVREHCDRLARIPLHGHVSSLNASVAVAVVLFEAVRQRRHTR